MNLTVSFRSFKEHYQSCLVLNSVTELEIIKNKNLLLVISSKIPDNGYELWIYIISVYYD